MCATPLFARLGIGRLRRVMQQPQPARGVAVEIVEIVARQIERERQRAHDICGKACRCREIGIHRRLEFRHVPGPLVGSDTETSGQHPRIVGGHIGTDVEPFLEIGRRTFFERLGLERFPAEAVPGAVEMHGILVRIGPRKERMGLRKNARDQGRIDPVIDQIEETVALGGPAQGRDFRRITGKELLPAEHGNGDGAGHGRTP
jgi:hypothetical protein